jgi:hypothetical protein
MVTGVTSTIIFSPRMAGSRWKAFLELFVRIPMSSPFAKQIAQKSFHADERLHGALSFTSFPGWAFDCISSYCLDDEMAYS